MKPRTGRAPVTPRPAPPPGPLASVLTGLVALSVSLLLAPGVPGDKDASEFTLVLAKLGVAHPTGYPLYTLLGHGFVTIAHALGVSWERAANAWSAVGGGLAAGLLHALAARLLAREGVSPRAAAWAAALPTAVFALNPLVTAETALAEVNSFHLAWVAAALLAVLSAADGLTTGDPARDTRRWAGLGALAGLGLAHHATSVLVIAPCGVALGIAAYRAGRLRVRPLAAAAAATLVPLVSYAFVAWRAFHPSPASWSKLGPGWADVVRHVTGAEYRIYLGRFAPAPEQLAALERYLWPWLGPLAVVALLWAWRARGTPGGARAAWAGALVLTVAYAFWYGVPDPGSYFLPAFLLATAAAPAAAARIGAFRRRGPALAVLVAVLVAAQGVAWLRVATERRRAYEAFERKVHALWTRVPYERGFVVWLSDMVHLLNGYQILRGEKPGIVALHPVELTHDAPRWAFVRRYGFDPVDRRRIGPRIAARRPANVEELSRAIGLAAAEEIAARSDLPVVLFLPEEDALRLIGDPADPGTAPAPGSGR